MGCASDCGTSRAQVLGNCRGPNDCGTSSGTEQSTVVHQLWLCVNCKPGDCGTSTGRQKCMCVMHVNIVVQDTYRNWIKQVTTKLQCFSIIINLTINTMHLKYIT